MFEKKEATHADAENMENSGDRLIVQQCAHAPQLCLHADQKGGQN